MIAWISLSDSDRENTNIGILPDSSIMQEVRLLKSNLRYRPTFLIRGLGVILPLSYMQHVDVTRKGEMNK